MPDEIIIKKWRCIVCNEIFNDIMEAARCEAEPVTKDKGAKLGDRVLITKDDGKGKTAIVNEISVLSKTYAGLYFWHTIAVAAKIENDWGTRFLTFDSYEVI